MAERVPHPCVDRGCHHPEAEHVATPELAGPEEVVVWCMSCRRHETRGTRRWFARSAHTAARARRSLGDRAF